MRSEAIVSRAIVIVFLSLAAVVVLHFSSRSGLGFPDTPIVFSLALALLWIIYSDLQWREIPDGASVIVCLLGAFVWSFVPGVLLINLFTSVTLTLVLGLLGAAFWRRTGREWLGLGDAKLIGAGTMLVGWDAVWLMLLLASVGGIVALCVGSARQEDRGVPFGPFLAYGIFATHLIAGPV